VRKRLPQLLDGPTTRRMLRDVDVQDVPAIVTDDKEAVQYAERNRWLRLARIKIAFEINNIQRGHATCYKEDIRRCAVF
jgi:hypothetical protein